MSEQLVKWTALTPALRDALIAEKVMGLRVEHWTQREFEGHDLRTGYVLIDESGAPCVPRYTTSMDAIKMLRQHMAQRFPLLNLHLVVYTYNRCYAAFSLDRPEESDEWSEGNGEYCMEDATCLAALRACGVVVE